MKDRAEKFQDASWVRGEARAGTRGLRKLRAVLFGLGGACLAGCSLSVPMGGGVTDDTPTGTIKQGHPSPFSAGMDAEDWRRAKSALDTALDPQGNGASVAWDNPTSGAKGAFVPVAQVYPKGEGICRAFTARLTLKDAPETLMRSSACRVNSGDWVVGPVGPEPAGKAARPRKSDNLAERATGTHLR